MKKIILILAVALAMTVPLANGQQICTSSSCGTWTLQGLQNFSAPYSSPTIYVGTLICTTTDTTVQSVTLFIQWGDQGPSQWQYLAVSQSTNPLQVIYNPPNGGWLTHTYSSQAPSWYTGYVWCEPNTGTSYYFQFTVAITTSNAMGGGIGGGRHQYPI